MEDVDKPFASGGEQQTRFGLIGRGIDTGGHEKRLDNVSIVGIHHHQHLGVAPGALKSLRCSGSNADPLEVANLGWHGIDGDRRLAFRRLEDRSGFPWLSASRLPDLLFFAPLSREDGAPGDLPTNIRTPDGEVMPVFGEGLDAEVGRRYGVPVQMMQLKHGIFDEASISVIAFDTVREISRLAGRSPDVRRFRPNVLVRLLRPLPFREDEWVGGVLSFGEDSDAPAIAVNMRDFLCSMVNLDPDSATPAPEVLKAVVRAHQNTAGVYGTVTRTGRLAVGQTILLRAPTDKRDRE
jgi:uncharacterized protein